MKVYSSDFETTTKVENLRVWASASIEIDTIDNYEVDENFQLFYNINDFMQFALSETSTHYFHNLKFDGDFILYYLHENGYTWTDEKKLQKGQYSTIIDDKTTFYKIEVCNGEKHKTIFLDSFKIIPFKAETVANKFKFDEKKLNIDYEKERPEGYIPTKEEISYIYHDVKIIGKAIKIVRNYGIDKMTIGSSALNYYKKDTGRKEFLRLFPPLKLEIDTFIRKSYKGGFTYVNPKFQGKVLGSGKVFDVNSLYPSEMLNKSFPVGEPIYFKGKYEKTDNYPLFIQKIECSFVLKKDKIPTIQIKDNLLFKATEYLENSKFEIVELTLTSVDLKLFFEHYEVYDLKYLGGYMFKAMNDLFSDYVNLWNLNKVNASVNKNWGLREVSKLFLNNLYGKYASQLIRGSRKPVFDDEKNIITFERLPDTVTKGVYLPVGTFITAYAREKTIRSAQENFDVFIYADTDSLHLLLDGDKMPKLEIDSNKIGCWDYEFKFSKAKFLRAKCYIEKGKNPNSDGEEKLKVTIAGMPSELQEKVNFKNFHFNSEVGYMLKAKRVYGGTVLEKQPYKINKRMFAR